jgi:hypothetical protein
LQASSKSLADMTEISVAVIVVVEAFVTAKKRFIDFCIRVYSF